MSSVKEVTFIDCISSNKPPLMVHHICSFCGPQVAICGAVIVDGPLITTDVDCIVCAEFEGEPCPHCKEYEPYE